MVLPFTAEGTESVVNVIPLMDEGAPSMAPQIGIRSVPVRQNRKDDM